MPTADPLDVRRPATTHGTARAVETHQLHKRFGRHRVLQGVDLSIPAGTISVVLGPSGAGKSVLIRHVLGLLKPDAGTVKVHDQPLGEMTRAQLIAMRRQIGVMFQDGALFSSMNVLDNVAFPLRQHTDLTEATIREIATRHLKAVGLENARGHYPSELSGGMKKRAGLARSLVLEPKILLCDEPDSGLDPVRTALLGELLIQRHEELGGTSIVVTHNVGLARLLADHVAILWRGQVVAQGANTAMFESPDPFVRQFLAGSTNGPLGMD